MSLNSKIEWTDATWNPIRGCTKISPGCAHCYAETFAERFRGVPGHPYEQGFDLRLIPEKLSEPLRWATPRMVFVNSMSDLFHEDVTDDYIEQVCRVMVQAPRHTFQVLTKRSERMGDLLRTRLGFAAREPHIWFGVSVENRKHGLPRIEHLRLRLPGCGCSRSSPCSKTWGRSISRASAGSSRAARAARGRVPWRPTGSGRFATSAGRRASRSSSSSGAACARTGPAASSTAGPMMNGRSVARADSLNG